MLCCQWQCKLRAAGKFPKRIGLCCPVKAMRSTGVLLQAVFAALVILRNADAVFAHIAIVRCVGKQNS